MPDIDVDSARAARREAQAKAPGIVFDGKRFELPVEMPFPVVEAFGQLQLVKGGATNTVLRHIFQSLLLDRYDEFMSHNPTVQDLMYIVSDVPAAYGMTVGELKASGSRSKDVSALSRPTSGVSTG